MRRVMKSILKISFKSILLLTLLFSGGCQGLFFSANNGNQPEEVDTGCAYFYFLWGRQAELSFHFEEALEAYQKALICDPDADYISRKIPILLLRLDRGNEAVELLKKYLQTNPEDTPFRMLLARVYIGLEKFNEAVDQYHEIHRRDPKETSALLLLSELYLNRDMLASAEQVLEEVLQVNQDSYPTHILLARIYFATKRYEQALAEYDIALQLNWSADMQIEKADVYARLGEKEKVIELYRDILKRQNDNEEAALALVNLLLKADKEKEALEILNTFKENSDLSEKAELSVARLYARMEEYTKAIDLLRSWLQKKDDSDARYLLAIILAQTEQYEQALAEIKLISKYDENYENALMLQVRILRFLDRYEDAIDLLEQAISDEETHTPDMFVMLAAMYHFQDKANMGANIFERALKVFPEDTELLYEYGLFLQSSGEEDKAMSIMEEVIKREPSHGEALNYVGYSWAEKNIHLDKALEYILKAVELKPDSGFVRDSLGWVYYRLGRIEEAREALELAVELSADDPEAEVFDHLGDVYMELGRKEDALQSYRQGLELFGDDEEDKLKTLMQQKLKLLEQQEKE